jgi:hypothetical protein
MSQSVIKSLPSAPNKIVKNIKVSEKMDVLERGTCVLDPIKPNETAVYNINTHKHVNAVVYSLQTSVGLIQHHLFEKNAETGFSIFVFNDTEHERPLSLDYICW